MLSCRFSHLSPTILQRLECISCEQINGYHWFKAFCNKVGSPLVSPFYNCGNLFRKPRSLSQAHRLVRVKPVPNGKCGTPEPVITKLPIYHLVLEWAISCLSFPQGAALICLGCHNKIAQTVWLKLQQLTFSWFWRLKVNDQGVGRSGFLWSLSSWLANACLLAVLSLQMLIPLGTWAPGILLCVQLPLLLRTPVRLVQAPP